MSEGWLNYNTIARTRLLLHTTCLFVCISYYALPSAWAATLFCHPPCRMWVFPYFAFLIVCFVSRHYVLRPDREVHRAILFWLFFMLLSGGQRSEDCPLCCDCSLCVPPPVCNYKIKFRYTVLVDFSIGVLYLGPSGIGEQRMASALYGWWSQLI